MSVPFANAWNKKNNHPFDDIKNIFLLQGLFSRITFAQPVLLGGTGSFRNTEHFLDTQSGFRGCIRRLEINNKIYNFEPAERQGDAIFGMDIGEYFPSYFLTVLNCSNLASSSMLIELAPHSTLSDEWNTKTSG